MRLHAVFASVQGEGARMGVPSVFIRLAGCGLRCPECDTKEAWTVGREVPLEEILAEVDALARTRPGSQAVITGGEPLEQDLAELTAALKRRGFFLALETNGRHFQALDVDWWTVSPKETGGYRVVDPLVPRIGEIKLVVTDALGPAVVARVRRMRSDVPLFLQPEAGDPRRYETARRLFDGCVAAGIPGLRLGLQLHRIYGIP